MGKMGVEPTTVPLWFNSIFLMKRIDEENAEKKNFYPLIFLRASAPLREIKKSSNFNISSLLVQTYSPPLAYIEYQYPQVNNMPLYASKTSHHPDLGSLPENALLYFLDD